MKRSRSEEERLFSPKNFVKLSEEVRKITHTLTWFELHGVEIVVLTLRVGLFIAAYYIFSLPGVIIKVIAMPVLSYFYIGIAITGTHETRHDSFLGTHKYNVSASYFFADFWTGQSSDFWYWRHVLQHHVYPRIETKDPDIYFYPWLNRYLYFFGIPYLLAAWVFIFSNKFLIKKRAWGKLVLYNILHIAGWVFHTVLFLPFFPVWGAILAAFIMRSLYAPGFFHLAMFNHIGLEDPNTRLPWLPLQTKTTRNLKTNWFLAGMGGNAFVDCHIEHHLYPTLSNRVLSKIRPVVMKYLKKEGYDYTEESYWSCLTNCIRYYKTFSAIGRVAL